MGKHHNLMGDKWLQPPACFMVCSSVVEPFKEAKIYDLIDQSQGCWNANLIAYAICSIPLSPRLGAAKIIRHFTKQGIFTVRTAYYVALKG